MPAAQKEEEGGKLPKTARYAEKKTWVHLLRTSVRVELLAPTSRCLLAPRILPDMISFSRRKCTHWEFLPFLCTYIMPLLG